jgi:type IX secretion system PorP/SprF family membrane protein
MRVSLLFFIMSCSIQTMGQLYPVFSQYYFNELIINPAYAGAQVQLSTTTTYRNQWVNFPGSPKTFSLTTHSSFLNGKIGLGLMIDVDKIGSYENTDVAFSYSYKLKFPQSTLSFGLQGVLYFINADFSALSLIDPGDPSFSIIKKFNPNVGSGVYYNRRNFFVGFSVPYLIDSKFSASGSQQLRNYFLRSGFYQALDARGNIKINPSILVRAQEGQPLSVDINNAFIFYDTFNVGLSYRTGDALISFVGLKISEKFFFSYSYDLTTSHISPFSTQELMLNYRARINAVHKNLLCPTYNTYRE